MWTNLGKKFNANVQHCGSRGKRVVKPCSSHLGQNIFILMQFSVELCSISQPISQYFIHNKIVVCNFIALNITLEISTNFNIQHNIRCINYYEILFLSIFQDVLHFRENFLNLDIYYKQLSVEEIIQQPAFEFLSLLSEVGGFLGLLLGASVLTVCEIFDFIIMTIVATCTARKIKAKKENESVDAEQQNGQRF